LVQESAPMINKVLIPLDGSTVAENVLPLARSFARGLHVPVQLLTVLDVVEIARRIPAEQNAAFRTLLDDTTRRCDSYLESVAKHFPVGRVHYGVQKGSAAEAIIESAAADKGTLIAMATHGRSGLDRWLLGSVAEKVLRAASNPVLLVCAKEKAPLWALAALSRIVVPLDGSERSEQVLPLVAMLAKALETEVVLQRVYGGPVSVSAVGDGFYSRTQLDSLLSELRAEAIDYLAAKADKMKADGTKNLSYVASEGHHRVVDQDDAQALAIVEAQRFRAGELDPVEGPGEFLHVSGQVQFHRASRIATVGIFEGALEVSVGKHLAAIPSQPDSGVGESWRR
jgi:nucleotide-binding universal stress UspA family protein